MKAIRNETGNALFRLWEVEIKVGDERNIDVFNLDKNKYESRVIFIVLYQQTL
jgi:hypothetical protein